MTPGKIIEATLSAYDHIPVCIPKRNGTPIEHLAWMAGEIQLLVTEGRIEKALRWLGFLQGALWALGLQSIEESKRHNMPEGVSFEQ